MISFGSPLYLLGLLTILPAVFFIAGGARPGVIRYSDTGVFSANTPTARMRIYRIAPWVAVSALALLITALARPLLGLKETRIRREGVDIILAIDVSSSMLAEDFILNGKQANRLSAVKLVARNFINGRPNDRVGMVAFAGKAYIIAPLSWDHGWNIFRLNGLRAGMVEEYGTAIGAALDTAVHRLRFSAAKSKVIILLTDGMNNSGLLMPEQAAETARQHGIVVYTIGAGTRGLVPMPTVDDGGRKIYRQQEVDIDEPLLIRIAEKTGGLYFRALDTGSLSRIFQRINRMARTSMEAPRYGEYLELYPYLLTLALVMLWLEAVLGCAYLRRLP
ncbi:MAG: VWA domain-containing protein [Bacillota bacterium]